MAHDNYDKFYTWNKGTLILDPGIFAWDEPHLEICDQPVPFANALDKIADRKFSKSCDYPARLLSFKHSPAPPSVLEKCETIVPGRSYCCPPYAMPSNWRMDYLPMDYSRDSLGQEVDDMNNNAAMSPEIFEYYIAVRKIGEETQAQAAPVVELVTDDARAAYKFLRAEMVHAGEAVPPVVEPARKTVRHWPLASVGIGIAVGLFLGKKFAR